MRDYALLEKISRLPDDVFVSPEEVAALTGFSAITIQQRKLRSFPRPMKDVKKLRWTLGEIRSWMRADDQKNAAAIAKNMKCNQVLSVDNKGLDKYSATKCFSHATRDSKKVSNDEGRHGT